MPFQLIINTQDAALDSLVADFLKGGVGKITDLARGDYAVPIVIRPVIPSEDDSRRYDDEHISTDNLELSIGRTDEPPETGTFALAIDGESTGMTALEFDVSASDLQTVLSAASVAGGNPAVTVTLVREGIYKVDGVTVGALPAISSASNTLLPSSYVSVTQVAAGDGSTKGQQYIRLIQQPVAFSEPDTELTAASVTATTEQAASSTTNKIVRITFTAGTYGGLYSLSVTANSVAASCGLVSPVASTTDVESALDTHPQLIATGNNRNINVTTEDGDYLIEFIGTLAGPANPTVTVADSSLLAPKGKSGTLNLNTVNLATAFWRSDHDELIFPITVKRERASGEIRTIYRGLIPLKRDIVATGELVGIGTPSVITEFATYDEAIAGTNTSKAMNPLRTAQAIAALGIGMVQRFDGATVTVYPPSADTAAARGTALAAAIAAASSGDEIKLGPGTYNGNITVPDGVVMRGAGEQFTTINGTITRTTPAQDFNVFGLTATNGLYASAIQIFSPESAAFGSDYNAFYIAQNLVSQPDGSWVKTRSGIGNRVAIENNYRPGDTGLGKEEFNFEVFATSAAGPFIGSTRRIFHFEGISDLSRGANSTFGDFGVDGALYVQTSDGSEPNAYISNLATGSILTLGAGTASLETRYKDAENAGLFVVGRRYVITATGTTNFTLIGAADSSPGTIFTATGAGTGTGIAIRLWAAADLVAGKFYEIKEVGSTNWTLIGAASNTVGVLVQCSGAGSGTGYAYRLDLNGGFRRAGNSGTCLLLSNYSHHGKIYFSADKGDGVSIANGAGASSAYVWLSTDANGVLDITDDSGGAGAIRLPNGSEYLVFYPDNRSLSANGIGGLRLGNGTDSLDFEPINSTGWVYFCYQKGLGACVGGGDGAKVTFLTTPSTGTLRITSDGSTLGSLEADASKLDFSACPTTDPAIAGRAWKNGDVLMISAG